MLKKLQKLQALQEPGTAEAVQTSGAKEKSTQELRERRKTLLLQCLSSTSYWQSLISCQLTKEKHLEGETNPETRPGLVCSICIMYYHEFSNLNNTHVLSHSFCELGVWHILSRLSAQGLTRCACCRRNSVPCGHRALVCFSSLAASWGCTQLLEAAYIPCQLAIPRSKSARETLPHVKSHSQFRSLAFSVSNRLRFKWLIWERRHSEEEAAMLPQRQSLE